jgi:hypothetical protein
MVMTVKTSVQQQWNIIYPMTKNYEVLDSALVDNEMWYTVKCSKEVGNWVRQQSKDQWSRSEETKSWLFYENRLDIHCELFVLLKLTWG